MIHENELRVDSQPHAPTRRRRRHVHQGETAKESNNKSSLPEQRSRITAYALLNEEKLIMLETQADWILKEKGIEFRGDDEALKLFKNAGAKVKGSRVYFETGHARSLCATAPSEFILHGRDPKHSFILGGDNIVLMPGYGSPFVTDLDHGRRYSTLKDFENFVKLAYLSPFLKHSGGTICEPVDVPVNKRHLDMVFGHLKYSSKPFMGGVTSVDRAQDSIEMARIIFGTEFMESHAVMQGNINVNSPLVYDETMSSVLRTYADANQCVAVSPAIFGGAMGPVSPAAIAAQTLAEGMVGIALSQLVKPGCPVIFGSFHSTMNLKSGALTFGTPEANLITMAVSQLGKRLNVPVRAGGGQITASNEPDGPAMQDSADAMWATLMSGANQVWHAAGWLEGGLTMSYEKFVMDLDHCGMMLRLLQGMDVDDEALAKDAYKEISPGDNFFSTAHTMRHFRTANYQSDLPEAGAYELWVENGRISAIERANKRWKEMLSNYSPPPLDQEKCIALEAFIEKRKAAMPDEWY